MNQATAIDGRPPDAATISSQLEELLPALYRTAYALCGNAVAAEDLVQTAVQNALPHWDRIHTGLKAYLRRSMANTHLNAIRAESVRRRIIHWVPPATTEDHAEQVVLRQDLLAVLQQLPHLDRTVLVLRYLDDLSVEDVAEIVQRPAGTVRRIAHTALKQLRDGGSGLSLQELP